MKTICTLTRPNGTEQLHEEFDKKVLPSTEHMDIERSLLKSITFEWIDGSKTKYEYEYDRVEAIEKALGI